MDESIYRTKQNLKTQINKIKESKILDRNKKFILNFLDECCAQGLSESRVLFYATRLWKIAQWVKKDFEKMEKEDIKMLIREIEEKDYKDWTKYCFKVAIKKFFQFAEGFEWNSKEYPEKVRWLRLSKKNSRKLPEEILTKEEVLRLIENASNIRDKALISTLYESGCRIGELLNLKLRNVSFDDYGAVIIVNGKTGSRRIRLVSFVPHLANWIENHPNKQNKESYLWTTLTSRNDGERITYRYVASMFKEVAKRAGVEKAVNPHNFRHSRATHLANGELNESLLCEYFGWVQGSKMASTYVHLSGRDLDNAILKIHGILPETEKKDELKVKECPRCKWKNPPELKFCNRCMLPLDEKVALELQRKESEFLKLITPEMIEQMIERKVQELLKNTKSRSKLLKMIAKSD